MFGLTYSYTFCSIQMVDSTLADCNRFDKGEINEVRIEWTLKRIQEYRRRTDETKTKLTETFLITPASIHTNKTKHQNKV